MQRRRFILAAAVAPLLATGCTATTDSLKKTINENDYRTYTENVDSVLISADGSKLVFLGAEYHYVFAAPVHLTALLDSPLHEKVKASMSQFNVDEDGNVSGNISIALESDSTIEKQQAALMGFEVWGESFSYQKIALSGKRYAAKGFEASKVDKKYLSKAYSVTVRDKNAFNGKKILYVLTPITVAADGVLTILAIPLYPVAIALLSSGR
jgi:hypothetical protein